MRRTFLRSKDAKALVVARNVLEMRTYRQGVIFKNPRATVGFVPTMGFLHEGHLSLFREARKNNDFVAASIFVNPSQFAAHEDFDVYPSNIERDLQYLKDEGVDVVFMPDSKESIVSIARWVLPVLVGPRTAVILCLVISIFGILLFLPTRYCCC